MSKALLALRKTDSPGFLPGLFSKLTRARLITKYPHSGIAVGGILYHTTLSNNLHASEFNPAHWDVFVVDVDHKTVIERYEQNSGAKYDWFSLLGFVLPWRVSVNRWLYCYEWCFLAITGKLPGSRVTPEDLLTLSRGRYGDEG